VVVKAQTAFYTCVQASVGAAAQALHTWADALTQIPHETSNCSGYSLMYCYNSISTLHHYPPIQVCKSPK
jgi:hypothetical protein